jgi:ribonuclease Z
MTEAAKLAKEAGVLELWLTHFSPATVNPLEFSDKVRNIFPQTVFPKDRRTVTLTFKEDK